MGGTILTTDVGLHLDDPPGAPAGGVVTDQQGSQERPAGLEGGLGEDRPIQDPPVGQRNG